VPRFVWAGTGKTLKPSELATQQSYKDGGKEFEVVGGLIMLGWQSRGWNVRWRGRERVYSYNA
jgi:hypothetical protein